MLKTLDIMKLNFVFFAALFVDNVNASCLKTDNAVPECRYNSGDSWCAEQRNGNNYAYSDKCLQQKQGLQTTQSKQDNPVPPSSRGTPITISGINVTMNKQQVYNELERRGYECAEKEETIVNVQSMELYGRVAKELADEVKKGVISAEKAYIPPPRDTIETQTACRKNSTYDSIRIYFVNSFVDWALFQCIAFNTCDYSLREAAQILVNSTPVKSLSISTERYITGGMFKKEEMLCGTGIAQDKVCISATKEVLIKRSGYGSSAPSYK
jgi:hypothetical protein